MNIAICLKENECEVMDFEDAYCGGPEGVEIGYLKINPDRIPVIMAANIAEDALARNAENMIKVDVWDGEYTLISDIRSVIFTRDDAIVCGTAYIVKKQGETYTALTYDEIDDWLCVFEEDELLEQCFYEAGMKHNCIHIAL